MVEPADFAFVGCPRREGVAVEAVDSYNAGLTCLVSGWPRCGEVCLLNFSVGARRVEFFDAEPLLVLRIGHGAWWDEYCSESENVQGRF